MKLVKRYRPQLLTNSFVCQSLTSSGLIATVVEAFMSQKLAYATCHIRVAVVYKNYVTDRLSA